MSLTDAWNEWQKSSLFDKWAKANPGEYQKLLKYRKEDPRPEMATAVGKALVWETDAWIEEEFRLGRSQRRVPTSSPAGITHWSEDWASGSVPANWLTQAYTANTTYAFVTDPLAQYGNVLKLQDVYDAGLATDYSGGTLQLVSLYRTAQNSKSGYQTVNEETWYRVRVMWPSGNFWCKGDEVNWTIEWHTDNDTQAQGGNSPGLYVRGGYPLDGAGTSSPAGFVLRWSSGTPSSPTNTYWPSADGSGAYAQAAPVAITTNKWYDMLFRVVWSKDPNVGFLEWWVDGVKQMGRNMATLYTNPNNFNQASYHTFGMYNYRYNISNTGVNYFDLCAAGTTRASVGA